MSAVDHHNAVLRRGEQRALELEDKLAALLEPILLEAGEQAARRFRDLAVDHAAAAARDRAAVKVMGLAAARDLVRSLALTAAVDVRPNSTMVAVKPRPEEAEAIADPDGYAADLIHVTLCYLGEIDGPLDEVADALRAVAANHAPLAGKVGGYGQFGMEDGSSVGILLPDVPGLVELRVSVTEALLDAGVGYSRDHGFEAHMTVDDEPEAGELEKMLPLSGSPLHFDELLLVRGDAEVVPLPLVGTPALTAAGEERYCLPAQLRTKTDPVRLEVVKTMMKASLEGVGLSFDVTNPLAAKVLAQSASQVTHISQTTQLDVMRVIRSAHDEGLSIDDTAAAIREKMRDSAPSRARLIARTELAGAVNGGSLAATRIVADATGEALYKRWMTAAGAKHPRHSTYPGLNGQTRQLDEPFEVGGARLDFPGDPAGPPDQVCNCRCALGYTDDPESLFASAGGPPCEADYYWPRQELVLLERTLSAAGPATWTSPAADEVLSVSCGAEAVQAGRAEAVAVEQTTATVGKLEAGDVFLYQGHRFKVLGEKGGGVEVQHVASKAKQVTSREMVVDLPPQARPPAPGRLVGRKAETHLNALERSYADRLSDVELRDLDNYVGVSYRTINGALRRDRPLGAVSERRVANIDSAIAQAAPLDEELVLWRGLNSWKQAFGDDLDGIVGRTFTDKAYPSTTTRQSIAYGAMGGQGANAAVLKIVAPRGTRGAWISGAAKPVGRADVRGLEHHLAKQEGEYLLPRGSKFRVVAVKQGRIPEVTVELVP